MMKTTDTNFWVLMIYCTLIISAFIVVFIKIRKNKLLSLKFYFIGGISTFLFLMITVLYNTEHYSKISKTFKPDETNIIIEQDKITIELENEDLIVEKYIEYVAILENNFYVEKTDIYNVFSKIYRTDYNLKIY